MGVIPQITCRRCRKKYSGLRSRCPYCGTKKASYSTRTPADTSAAAQGPDSPARSRADQNAKWQFIFGCVVLAAVIVAVIVLITSSLSAEKDPPPVSTPPVTETTPPPPPSTPPPTPSPSPTPQVDSVIISYLSQEKKEFTMRVGDTIPLTATVYPLHVLAEVVWSSTDEGVCTVDQTGAVVGVGAGTAYVQATAGAVTQQCKVIVR